MARNSKKRSNGEGTIYYEESRKRWVAEIAWQDRLGETHKKRFTAQKQVAAKTKLNEFKRQLLIRQGDVEKASVTFEEFSKLWIENTKKNRVKPTALMRKECTLRNQVYPHLGSLLIDDITGDDVERMIHQLEKKELSFSTIKKAYEAVNGCYRYYREKTKKPLNPCEGISLPVQKKKADADIVYFEADARKKIREEALRQYQNGTYVYRHGWAIIALMYTGMRLGELMALQWSDIDFEQRLITISKNLVYAEKDGKRCLIIQDSTKTTEFAGRIIPMTQNAAEAFAELKKLNGGFPNVIMSKNGNQLYPWNIERPFQSILERAGIDVPKGTGPHALRHTFASMLFENGCAVKVVSELLGHKDTKVTENIYIHLIQKQKIKAIQCIDQYCS